MTNELEQEIYDLEEKVEELQNEIEHLENELIYKEDEIMELEHDLEILGNKIIDLEYELFNEKTSDSSHKFYWFTAKKTPLVSDVSYMGKEKHLFGFKQVPKYEFIEQHDLRFITNCSLDDLTEQVR